MKQFYINGEWVNPHSNNTCAVINPSTGEAFTDIILGDETDTNAAVAAAKSAFASWSQTSVAERAEILTRFLTEYQARIGELGAAISQEMGAPIDLATGMQAEIGIARIMGIIDALKDFKFEYNIDDAGDFGVVHEPIGVTALIAPWNWPMNQVTLKVAPALATGCTMVLKPSELSPISSMILAQAIDAAGVPAGVFNLINGDGAGVGSQLSQHPDVDMVSFTGSTRAGKAISKAAADTIKRVTLELGGKGANLVFADADEQAVARGTSMCFLNSGQSCNAPTRMLVEASAYDNAVATAAEVAANTPVALASEHGQHLGPVVSEQQYQKIQAYIQTGLDQGARLVAGGLGKPAGLEAGYFVKPTVFADVSPDMTIAKEEIFGPVLSIMKFTDEAQAVAIANDTPYGLTNYLQTQDPDRIARVSRQLRSGMVEINGRMGVEISSPFGGYKQSGNSSEGGRWGLEEFLLTKAVSGW